MPPDDLCTKVQAYPKTGYKRVVGVLYLYLTDASYINHGDSRFAVLTLSLRFGKAVAGQRKKEQSGAGSEQDRVKN